MSKAMHFTKKDFRVDWFSGSGAGGQYRNKHRNCCRITHIQTGLCATGQSHRERPANQREAFKRLAGMLLARLESPAQRRCSNDVVRTYHFERAVATDGDIVEPVQPVLDGKLDRFIVNALTGRRPVRETGRV